MNTHEEIRGWLIGRLPKDWFEANPDVTIDREEITIVGRLSTPDLARVAVLDSDGHRILERAVERLALSARAIERVRRLARTIADMEGSDPVCGHHVAEALQYRFLDKETA